MHLLWPGRSLKVGGRDGHTGTAQALTGHCASTRALPPTSPPPSRQGLPASPRTQPSPSRPFPAPAQCPAHLPEPWDLSSAPHRLSTQLVSPSHSPSPHFHGHLEQAGQEALEVLAPGLAHSRCSISLSSQSTQPGGDTEPRQTQPTAGRRAPHQRELGLQGQSGHSQPERSGKRVSQAPAWAMRTGSRFITQHALLRKLPAPQSRGAEKA